MSDREKKLLAVLLIALFIIANSIGFTKFYSQKINQAKLRKATAEAQYRQAELILQQKDDWGNTVNWLKRAEGKPTTYQDANASLQSYLKKSADRRGLETRKEDILDPVRSENYHRVRVRYKVNGVEKEIQQWILDIHRPQQLQVITKFDVQPQKNDTTRADCEVEVEKWFVPIDKSSTLIN